MDHPADKKLLQAVGSSDKGKRSPVFRSGRPGYWPWVPTSEEALLLHHALLSVLAADRDLARLHELGYWNQPDVYPLAIPSNGGYTWEPFRPLKEVLNPKPVPVDQERVDQFLRAGLARSGVIDALALGIAPVVLLTVGTILIRRYRTRSDRTR
jgi:hypothetical protein